MFLLEWTEVFAAGFEPAAEGIKKPGLAAKCGAVGEAGQRKQKGQGTAFAARWATFTKQRGMGGGRLRPFALGA
jgi:hypothetical protein